MTIIGKRLDAIKPSATLAVSQRALELKRQGVDVYSLSAGEPDFPTPEHIIEAAYQAMKDGKTRYTAVDGTPELKKAIRDKFLRENDLDYQMNEIMASTGGKQVIFNAFFASLNRGDEVIIPAPFWVSYPDIVELADGVPVILPTAKENHFKITADRLDKAINSRTKWLVINSPCNPTGSSYTEQELKQLAEVLLKHPHVYIMSDDIYEHILYTNEPFKTIAQVEPRLKDRVLTINGVSKSYSMTGWRLGFAGGPSSLIKAMVTIQSQSTSNPCSITQAATVAALNGSQKFLQEHQEEFRKRRDFVVSRVNSIQGLSCLMPEGAFYVFVECAGIIGKKTPEGTLIQTDLDFADYLISSANVAVVAGSPFGLSPYIRLSYATDMETLRICLDRIAKAVSVL